MTADVSCTGKLNQHDYKLHASEISSLERFKGKDERE